MASNGHITHSAVTFGLGAACAAIAYTLHSPSWTAVSVGLFSGLLLTPDLDLNKGCTATRAFLPWHVIWWPYSRIVRHRSWVSHLPVVSTGIRLLYLAAWLVVPALYIWRIWPGALVSLASLALVYGVFAFLGLCAADTAHWLMDGLPKASRRRMWAHRHFPPIFRSYKTTTRSWI